MKKPEIDSQMVSLIKMLPKEQKEECLTNDYLVEKTIQCEKCDLTFCDEINMINHKRMHKQENDLENKNKVTRYSLKEHPR